MLHWLSFADPDGGGNLGVAIVDAVNFGHAIAEAHRLGINPGGEVAGIPIPEVMNARYADCTGRLMQQAELIERT